MRLIAPPDKLKPWLDKQTARGRHLLELPLDTHEQIAEASWAVHLWYLHLFEGFKRAVHTDDPFYELNLNMVISDTAHTGGTIEGEREMYRVQIERYLEMIEQIRGLC